MEEYTKETALDLYNQYLDSKIINKEDVKDVLERVINYQLTIVEGANVIMHLLGDNKYNDAAMQKSFLAGCLCEAASGPTYMEFIKEFNNG